MDVEPGENLPRGRSTFSVETNAKRFIFYSLDTFVSFHLHLNTNENTVSQAPLCLNISLFCFYCIGATNKLRRTAL